MTFALAGKVFSHDEKSWVILDVQHGGTFTAAVITVVRNNPNRTWGASITGEPDPQHFEAHLDENSLPIIERFSSEVLRGKVASAAPAKWFHDSRQDQPISVPYVLVESLRRAALGR